MLIPVAVLVVRAVLGRPRGDSLLIACYAVLVVFALAGPVTVLFSGGFGFPVPWL